jgi:hypothetical protein
VAALDDRTHPRYGAIRELRAAAGGGRPWRIALVVSDGDQWLIDGTEHEGVCQRLTRLVEARLLASRLAGVLPGAA